MNNLPAKIKQADKRVQAAFEELDPEQQKYVLLYYHRTEGKISQHAAAIKAGYGPKANVWISVAVKRYRDVRKEVSTELGIKQMKSMGEEIAHEMLDIAMSTDRDEVPIKTKADMLDKLADRIGMTLKKEQDLNINIGIDESREEKRIMFDRYKKKVIDVEAEVKEE